MAIDKKVSIVIPTFNRADLLVTTIETCLAQTTPCEIIVCDHGSTDNTAHVVEPFKRQGVIYLRREKDFGPHFCWLDGILNASHNLIHIQYDDDWIEPTFIEECLNVFTEQTAFVFTKAKGYDEKTKHYFELFFNFGDKPWLKSKRVIDYILVGNLISPGSAIYRKEDMIDNLFMNKVPHSSHSYFGVGPDALFSLMSAGRYKQVGFVNKSLAIFRSHEGSITVNALGDTKKKRQKTMAYVSAAEYFLIDKIVQSFFFGKVLIGIYLIVFANKKIYFDKLIFKKYPALYKKLKYKN